MAGRNQHFIPQSVLRAFARDERENPKRVWRYMRDAPIAAVATDKVASERHFYSVPVADGTSLDDKITAYENDVFNSLVSKLRAASPGDHVSHVDAAAYLGHLVPRSDHMRRVLGDATGAIFGDMRNMIGDPGKLAGLLGFDELAPGGKALEEIRRMMRDERFAPFIAVFEVPPQLIERLGFALLREFSTPLLSDAGSKAAAELVVSSIDVKAMAADAHQSVLEEVGVDHAMPGLEPFEFSVVATSDEMILPDCVAIAICSEGRARPLNFMKRDEVAVIVSPLSPHRLLVGRRVESATFSREVELPALLASCSQMFFVARSDSFRGLYESLGQVARAEIEEMREGFLAPKPLPVVPKEVSDRPSDASFTLHAGEGFAADEVEAIGQGIKDLASKLWGGVPIECLARVTVSDVGGFSDLGAFLADACALDGEVESGSLRAAVVLPHAVGAAYCWDVSQEEFAAAHLTAAIMLIRAGAAGRLDRISPKYFRAEACMHYRGMAFALPVFFGVHTLRSLVVEGVLLEQIDAAAANALSAAAAKIVSVKSSFEESGDSAAFARSASHCVSKVACAAAAAAAAAGVVQGSLDLLPRFQAALENASLTLWFARYVRDLENFWDAPRALQEPSDWGIHSERLLLQWGIVSWYVAPGRVRWRLPPQEVVELISAGLRSAAEYVGTPPKMAVQLNSADD